MALADSQIRKLLDAAPDPTIIVNEGGRIVFASTRVRAVFGYDPADLVGRSVEELLPERYRFAHQAQLLAFFDSPRTRPFGTGQEFLARHRDGSEFPVEISLSSVRTDEGVLVSSTIRDRSVHRRFEKNLTGIFESSLNEIYIFDASTLHFIQANEGAQRNLGYNMDEMRNLTPADLKPEFTIETFRQLVAPLRDGLRDKIEFATIHERKDGSRYPVEVHLQHMEFEDSTVFVAIILDITQRKEVEEALKASHEELEARVRERTRDLEDTKREAEQANTTKSRFLAAASHDLRQPLQSFGLYLSVLDRQLDRPQQKEVSDKMRRSLDSMGELLDALLDISRFDSGSVTVEASDFHIQDILEHIVTDNYQQAVDKGLRFECTATDLVVHSDPILLERVVENFVTNAIRYTEQGHVSVTCQCAGNTARISVTDTGIGMQEDSLDAIFEEYYQLDNPGRERRQGLGLGLSIVKHIARLLDHPIHVSSVPGKGSTFSVEVPLGDPSTPRPVSKSTGPETLPAGEEPVVLFVDDDPVVVDATTMLLQSAGVRIHSAPDGDAALSLIREGLRPDIIVSDYRLPGYSGIELVRRVREATVSDLPAVIMTGDVSPREFDSAALPNCQVLYKPVDTQRLLNLVEALGR